MDPNLSSIAIAVVAAVPGIIAAFAARKSVAQNHELKEQGRIIQNQTDGQLSHLTELLDAEHKKNEELRKLITALVDKDIEVRQAKAAVDSQNKADESRGRIMRTETPFPPANPI